MKKESYMKKLILESEINNCLFTIEKSIVSTISYLSGDTGFNEYELIEELDYAQTLINNVDKLILALEKEFECDIDLD